MAGDRLDKDELLRQIIERIDELRAHPGVREEEGLLYAAVTAAARRTRKTKNQARRRLGEDPAAPSRKGRRCHSCGCVDVAIDGALCTACLRGRQERVSAKADLAGRRAFITGGRSPIGRAVVERLLEAGAEVTTTSRFADATYALLPSESELTVHEVDFTVPCSVERLCEKLRSSYDIVIFNAAQTTPQGLERPSHTPGGSPASWMMELEDVPYDELRGAMEVNAMAPFRLLRHVVPLMEASPFESRFVVFVTGLDGLFDGNGKMSRHVHVNMSKAAENMLAHTVARRLAQRAIYCNVVDPGWVTDERPHDQRLDGGAPTVSTEEAAARVCQPIEEGVEGSPAYDRLYRHFEARRWS